MRDRESHPPHSGKRPAAGHRTFVRACATVAGSAFVMLLDPLGNDGVGIGGIIPQRPLGSFRSLIKSASSLAGGGFASPEGAVLGGREHGPGPVFYNIFVPPDDPDGRANALKIVREQLRQMDSAVHSRDLPIRYSLLGDVSASDEIETACRSSGRRECTMISSAEKGNEWATLQPLYEYCRDLPQGGGGGNNTSVWVSYVHNKGSFHPSHDNDVLRQMNTKATFSEECQTAPGETCNICSARFSPVPFLHSSSNIWTADCDYVRQLIPPLYFFPAMEDVFDEKVQEVLGWANGGKGWRDERTAPSSKAIAPAPFRPEQKPKIYEQIWFTGRGRFSMEHWVHSHPAQRPCDVFPGGWNLAFENLPPSGTDWTPDLQAAPRADRESLEKYPFGNMERMREDEWYCGKESRLYEFGRLYGERPADSSWFWRFYEASKDFCAA